MNMVKAVAVPIRMDVNRVEHAHLEPITTMCAAAKTITKRTRKHVLERLAQRRRHRDARGDPFSPDDSSAESNVVPRLAAVESTNDAATALRISESAELSE